jgi:hypothetical protein
MAEGFDFFALAGIDIPLGGKRWWEELIAEILNGAQDGAQCV